MGKTHMFHGYGLSKEQNWPASISTEFGISPGSACASVFELQGDPEFREDLVLVPGHF